MEFIPQVIGAGLLGVIGWFCSNVLTRLESIKNDIHVMAEQHGERLARLEVSSHAKDCTGYNFRRRMED